MAVIGEKAMTSFHAILFFCCYKPELTRREKQEAKLSLG